MWNAHYEEQDPERYFFMVEALRRSVWPTHRLLATSLTLTNKLIYIFYVGADK